jgi:hypothetical protein
MRRITIASLIAILFTVSGCLTPSKPIAPPVSDEQLAQLKRAYAAGHPDARVGEVTAVLTSDNLALVGKISAKDFSIGDIITFMDSNGQVLTMGHVEHVNKDDTITVRYEAPAKDSRAPLVGDVAVRLIS